MKEKLKSLKLIFKTTYPNLHENCKCKIVNGKWILGVSESGPCPICQDAADQYNSK